MWQLGQYTRFIGRHLSEFNDEHNVTSLFRVLPTSLAAQVDYFPDLMVDRAVSLDSEKIAKDKLLRERKNNTGGSHSPYSRSGMKYGAIPTEKW